ncbi:MAG: MASE1 domain-containing protein [Actinobacteria bacterium]|nr:MASE1 domain-containing protein [Actinomycetota bacterium]
MPRSREGEHRSGGLHLLRLLSLGAAYFLSAKIGLLFAALHLNVSPVWPAAGIALAALVLGGKNLWPAIALGAVAADLSSGVSLFPAAGNAAANTVEALVGAVLLSRLFAFSPDLRRSRDAFSIAAVSVLAPLVGAAIGIAALVVDTIPVSEAWYNYQLWWFGDAMALSFLPR